MPIPIKPIFINIQSSPLLGLPIILINLLQEDKNNLTDTFTLPAVHMNVNHIF